MNWTTNLIRSIFRIDKSDGGVRIVDGVIVSEEQNAGTNPVTHPSCVTADHTPETTDSLIPAVSIAEPPRYYPIATPIYYPTYLLDTDSGGDIGLFVHWLSTNRYKSFPKFVGDLTMWKRQLRGHIDAQEIIRILGEFSPGSAKRKLYTLRLYASYRHDYGDPRLIIILASQERNLKLPASTRTKFTVGLSPALVWDLNDKAKAWCREAYILGVWLGLMIRGIPSASIESVEILDDRTIRFRAWSSFREQQIPEWLMQSMTHRIAPELWRRNRVTIRNKLKAHIAPEFGITPTVLYRNAESALRILGE